MTQPCTLSENRSRPRTSMPSTCWTLSIPESRLFSLRPGTSRDRKGATEKARDMSPFRWISSRDVRGDIESANTNHEDPWRCHTRNAEVGRTDAVSRESPSTPRPVPGPVGADGSRTTRSRRQERHPTRREPCRGRRERHRREHPTTSARGRSPPTALRGSTLGTSHLPRRRSRFTSLPCFGSRDPRRCMSVWRTV